LFSPLPDMALRLESQQMHHLVREWLEETAYDIVQIEGIELAQYARHVDSRTCALVFDNHNCEYLLQQRNALTDLRKPRRIHAALYSLVQWAKLRRYEAQVCNSANAVVAVSESDKRALQRIAPNAAIHVAPNGIDLSAYDATPVAHPANSRFTLLFTGKMDYRPNIDAVLWFAQEVLPSLVAAEQQIRFQIVGMNPHARLDTLRNNPHIDITGAVPDPVPYLAAANIFVIPMRVGGGTRFKALEAMAAAKAIVSTTLGVEGIGVHAGEQMLIADTPEEFAVSVLRLIADQRTGSQLSRRLGQNARDFVGSRYTWDRIIPNFDRLYERLQPQQTLSNPRPLIQEGSGTHHDHTGVKP
jgi:glycosyltransferase involved in cell wall biosynthesis